MQFKTTEPDQKLTITMTQAQASFLIGSLNQVQKIVGLDVTRQMAALMDAIEAHEPVVDTPADPGGAPATESA